MTRDSWSERIGVTVCTPPSTPLADFQSALDELDAGRVRGRAILVS